MKRYCCATIIFLTSLVFLIYSINFYFLSRLSSPNLNSNKFKPKNSQENFDYVDNENEQINYEKIKLKAIYRVRNPKFVSVREKLIRNYTPCSLSMNYSQIWSEIDSVSLVNISICFQFTLLHVFTYSGLERHQMRSFLLTIK